MIVKLGRKIRRMTPDGYHYKIGYPVYKGIAALSGGKYSVLHYKGSGVFVTDAEGTEREYGIMAGVLSCFPSMMMLAVLLYHSWLLPDGLAKAVSATVLAVLGIVAATGVGEVEIKTMEGA